MIRMLEDAAVGRIVCLGSDFSTDHVEAVSMGARVSEPRLDSEMSILDSSPQQLEDGGNDASATSAGNDPPGLEEPSVDNIMSPWGRTIVWFGQQLQWFHYDVKIRLVNIFGFMQRIPLDIRS